MISSQPCWNTAMELLPYTIATSNRVSNWWPTSSSSQPASIWLAFWYSGFRISADKRIRNRTLAQSGSIRVSYNNSARVPTTEDLIDFLHHWLVIGDHLQHAVALLPDSRHEVVKWRAGLVHSHSWRLHHFLLDFYSCLRRHTHNRILDQNGLALSILLQL